MEDLDGKQEEDKGHTIRWTWWNRKKYNSNRVWGWNSCSRLWYDFPRFRNVRDRRSNSRCNIFNIEKVKGFFITHGHEDHIGAIPYILKQVNVPIFATNLTVGLIESKLEEHKMLDIVNLNVVKPGDIIKLDKLKVEFIRTNHSIADSCSLAIHTPLGIIIHTGDFKVDFTPVDGNVIDLQRFAKLGKQGVLLLMADSTNACHPGYTMSEKTVGEKLDNLFSKGKGRIIVATFASNIHRLQQIINSSIKYGRKVAFSGRSMEKISDVAVKLGYLDMPEGLLVDLKDLRLYNNDQITIVTTGSQGEPMSALTRIASSTHKNIQIEKDDMIIISASPIPGNEKAVSRVINELTHKGAEVIYKSIEEIHVSGHACEQELKLIHSILKPFWAMISEIVPIPAPKSTIFVFLALTSSSHKLAR